MRRVVLGAAAFGLLGVLATVTGFAATLQVDSGTIDTFSDAAAATTTTTTTTGDTRAPVLQTLEMFDVDADGRVDQVTATFDEALASYTAGTTPWTLTNVPSGGTLATVSVTGAVATLAITEGSGAEDTAVGSFTVALAQHTGGVRDAAGNRSSFAATGPLDRAAPRLLDVRDSDSSGGAGDGLFQTNDWVELVASEPISIASLPTTTSATVLDPTGNGDNDDQLAIGGVLDGSMQLGAGYVTKNNVTNVFAGSAVALTNGGRHVRVTLGSCSGCSDLGRGSGTASFRLSPTVLATDGRQVSNSVTKAISLF